MQALQEKLAHQEEMNADLRSQNSVPILPAIPMAAYTRGSEAGMSFVSMLSGHMRQKVWDGCCRALLVNICVVLPPRLPLLAVVALQW